MTGRERQADPRLIEWGMRLRRYREAQNRSIEELADQAGVAARQLIRVEHGKASPSVLWILNVAKALGIHAAELFRDPPEDR